MSKLKFYKDIGEPGIQFISENKSEQSKFTEKFFKSYPKLKSWSSKKPRNSSTEYIFLKSFGGSKKSLWTRFKDLFKREYKKKEIFNKDGELDVKALMSNFKNKKKELEVMELSELTEGYIHVPYLPTTPLPFISSPTVTLLNGKPKGMTELIVDTEETYEDK